MMCTGNICGYQWTCLSHSLSNSVFYFHPQHIALPSIELSFVWSFFFHVFFLFLEIHIIINIDFPHMLYSSYWVDFSSIHYGKFYSIHENSLNFYLLFPILWSSPVDFCYPFELKHILEKFTGQQLYVCVCVGAS